MPRLERRRQGVEQALGEGHALTQASGLQSIVGAGEPFRPGHLGHQPRELVKPADGRVGRAWPLLHGARMARTPDNRPVQQPAQPDGPRSRSSQDPLQDWPEGSQAQARALHEQLRIGERQWHALKGQPQRRAAEQLAAALVQLLDPANPPGAPCPGPQRRQAADLVENALGWLRGELRDPGCPSHGR